MLCVLCGLCLPRVLSCMAVLCAVWCVSCVRAVCFECLARVVRVVGCVLMSVGVLSLPCVSVCVSAVRRACVVCIVCRVPAVRTELGWTSAPSAVESYEHTWRQLRAFRRRPSVGVPPPCWVCCRWSFLVDGVAGWLLLACVVGFLLTGGAPGQPTGSLRRHSGPRIRSASVVDGSERGRLALVSWLRRGGPAREPKLVVCACVAWLPSA